MGATAGDGDELKRPATVTSAVCLIIATLILGTVSTMVNVVSGQSGFEELPQTSYIAPMLIVLVGFAILEATFAYGIWIGHNWARIAYAIFAAWGVWNLISSTLRAGSIAGLSLQPARLAFSALLLLADLTAVVLLFLPASSAWFRNIRSARHATEGKTKRKPKRKVWLDRWLAPYTSKTLILSLVAGLIMSWVAGMLAAATWAGVDAFLGVVAALYGISCFPVQAAVLALGAGLGAWVGKRNGDVWRGSTLGVWIAIAVVLIIGIGGGLALRNSNW